METNNRLLNLFVFNNHFSKRTSKITDLSNSLKGEENILHNAINQAQRNLTVNRVIKKGNIPDQTGSCRCCSSHYHPQSSNDPSLLLSRRNTQSVHITSLFPFSCIQSPGRPIMRLTRNRVGSWGDLQFNRVDRQYLSMTTSPRLNWYLWSPNLLTSTQSRQRRFWLSGFNVGCIDFPSIIAIHPTDSFTVQVKGPLQRQEQRIYVGSKASCWEWNEGVS